MKYLLVFLSLAILSCSSLNDPPGNLKTGDELYFNYLTGNLEYQYNDTVSAWVLQISTGDSVFVDCRLRKSDQYVWFEPDSLYFDNWTIRIGDRSKKYTGYEYRVMLILK